MLATPKSYQRLHEFLRNEHEPILAAWEKLDRGEIESARHLSSTELRNNIPSILTSFADIAEMAGGETHEVEIPSEGPEGHAQHRWSMGFSLEEVTREYAFLRTVILQKLVPRVGELSAGELVLLNQALDQAIIQSVVTFVTKSNRELESEREHLQVTLRSISDAVISTDVDGRVTYCNPAAEHLTGWSREEALGRPVTDVLVTFDDENSQIVSAFGPEGMAEAQRPASLLRRSDGDLLPVEKITLPLWSAKGESLGAVTTVRDMSAVHALTSKLSYQASHDPLTDLPNRAFLREQLDKEIERGLQNNTNLALLYLDLDLFKDVNDMLGHAVGDDLLRQVAKRLQHCVRDSDTVSRLGGDEFIILLVDFDPLSYLGEVSQKLARHLRAPFVLGDETVELHTSIGISVFPHDGDDADTLIRHADAAMYHAKSCGRNNVQFYAPSMDRQASERYHLENDLRKAIPNHEMSLKYQPQISLTSGQIVGAEVLLRWQHPEKGKVPPGRFIPIAEHSGHLMISIGDWVVEQACQQMRAWDDAGKGNVRVSVNVSMAQLRHKGFRQHVANMLDEFGLAPEQLQLEMTESIIMSDVMGAQEHLRELKDLGVQVAVDDFGTGYSSLGYLKDLPVDELKIDQSFLQDIGSDENKAAIVRAVIRMGQSLNLRVIAEGVEEQAVVSFLSENECEAAQGYYYSRAITPSAFERNFLSP